MGSFIGQQGLAPDLLVSSNAARAKATAEIVVANCCDLTDKQLLLEPDFYLAPASVYLEFLSNRLELISANVETIMLVGHNPGLEDLVETLSGRWETMPTAAIAYFRVSIDNWQEFGAGVGQFIANAQQQTELMQLWRPKDLHME